MYIYKHKTIYKYITLFMSELFLKVGDFITYSWCSIWCFLPKWQLFISFQNFVSTCCKCLTFSIEDKPDRLLHVSYIFMKIDIFILWKNLTGKITEARILPLVIEVHEHVLVNIRQIMIKYFPIVVYVIPPVISIS